MAELCIFRVNGASTEPERVRVDEEDVAERIAVGDHFMVEAEAWDWIDRDVRAQVRLVAGEIVRLRKQLARAETEAADAAIRMAAIENRRAEAEEERGEQ
jgi:hypothetical protein